MIHFVYYSVSELIYLAKMIAKYFLVVVVGLTLLVFLIMMFTDEKCSEGEEKQMKEIEKFSQIIDVSNAIYK